MYNIAHLYTSVIYFKIYKFKKVTAYKPKKERERRYK